MGLLDLNLGGDQSGPVTSLLGAGISDPRSAALVALGGSMVRGDFGGGLLAANKAIDDTLNSSLQRENLAQQIGLRNIQLQQAQQQWDMMRPIFQRMSASFGGQYPSTPQSAQPAGGPGAPLTGGPSGGSPSMGGPSTGQLPSMAPSYGQSGAFITGLTPDQLAFFKLTGHDLTDVYKLAKEGMERKPNTFYEGMDGGLRYFADPTKMVDYNPQTGAVSPMRGAIPTQAALTMASEAPKAVLNAAGTVNLRPNADGTQTPTPVLRETPELQSMVGQFLGSGQLPPTAPTASAPQLRNQGPGTLTPQLQKAIADDAAANGVTNPQVQFSAPGMRNPVFGWQPNGQQQTGTGPVTAPGVGYGPTFEQQAQAAANKTFQEGRAKTANDYESGLNARVDQGAALNMRLQEQLNALDQFRAGGGAQTRERLAQIAQAIPGVPTSVISGIAGGNLAAMQEFNKLAAQTAMEQLKQSMGGAGRVAQYEFRVFQENNPNLSTDPNAIRKISDFNTRLYNRDVTEQQAFNAHIANGGNPAEFPMLWQQQQAKLGFTNPNLNAQPAIDLPGNPSAQNLTIGQIYKLPNGQSATWDGFMFRGK